MYRPSAKSHQFGDLQDAGALAHCALRLSLKLDSDRRPTKMFALSHGPFKTKFDPLPDHAALELGKRLR
jgi:hypothetical protein